MHGNEADRRSPKTGDEKMLAHRPCSYPSYRNEQKVTKETEDRKFSPFSATSVASCYKICLRYFTSFEFLRVPAAVSPGHPQPHGSLAGNSRRNREPEPTFD